MKWLGVLMLLPVAVYFAYGVLFAAALIAWIAIAVYLVHGR